MCSNLFNLALNLFGFTLINLGFFFEITLHASMFINITVVNVIGKFGSDCERKSMPVAKEERYRFTSAATFVLSGD